MSRARGVALALLVAAVAAGTPPLHAQGAAAPDGQCPVPPVGSVADPLVAARRLVAGAEACRDAGAFEHGLDLLDPLLYRRDAPAEAWYLAGRAKLGLAELEAVPRWRDHQRPGTSYAQGARRALAEAELKAEQKAARDARYAARKAAKKKRRRGL